MSEEGTTQRMKKISYCIKKFLGKPVWMLIACFSAVCTHLAFDGTFIRILRLSRSRQVLEARITDIQNKNILVKKRLKKWKSDSRFLKQEARNRLNLVGEEDIIFIFPDEDKQ